MGSYTTGKYKLYKAASSELVSADQVLKYNWDIIDPKMYNTVEYHLDTDTFSDADDTIVGIDCWKYYHYRSGKLFVVPYRFGGSTLIQKCNNINTWTPINLIGGATSYNSSEIDRPAWRYVDAAHSLVEFRGKMAGTLTRNTTINVTNSGEVPNASGFSRLVHVPVNVSSANPDLDDMARVQVGNTGQVTIVRYGQASMTDRYIDLAAVRYSTI